MDPNIREPLLIPGPPPELNQNPNDGFIGPLEAPPQ